MAGPMNFMTKHIWPRRKTMAKKEKIDRISNLPEEILQSILSLLPTKDATRTIVLSKQWKNLWESFVHQGQDLILPTTKERQVFRFLVVEYIDDDLSLILGGYDLDMVDDEMRNGMHRLCLTNVVVADDKALENFISKCIFLKELDLNFSDGLKLGGSHWRHEMPTMPSCTTLKRLTLKIPNMRGNWFQNQIVSKLPFLEELELDRCYMLESIHILSTSLKRLCLIKCHSLKEINIDTPNLTFFEYRIRNIIPFTSMKMKANWVFLTAKIHLYTKEHRDALWLIKLVCVVKKFSQSSGFETRITRDITQMPSNWMLLSLSVENRRGEDMIYIPKELKGNFLPPLVAVHHLTLDVGMKQKSYKEYVAPSRWFPFHSVPSYKKTKFNDLYREYLLEEVRRREKERSLKSPLSRVRQFLTHL